MEGIKRDNKDRINQGLLGPPLRGSDDFSDFFRRDQNPVGKNKPQRQFEMIFLRRGIKWSGIGLFSISIT
jgi:hypothetical protein